MRYTEYLGHDALNRRLPHRLARAQRPHLIGCLALLAALAACGGGGDKTTAPPTPRPGVLAVRLTTPNADDRAVRLTVTGGPVTDVQAPAGLTVHGAPAADGAHVVAVGPLAAGEVARLAVPDLNRAGAYRAALVEVADSRYALRPDGLAGYTVSIGVAP